MHHTYYYPACAHMRSRVMHSISCVGLRILYVSKQQAILCLTDLSCTVYEVWLANNNNFEFGRHKKDDKNTAEL